MGNILAANVPPTSLASAYNLTSNVTDGKMMLWKLTRTMKAAGWVYKSSGKGNVGGTIGKDASLSTTIAAGSNGQSLPQATINVASTTGFPASGTIFIVTSAGTQAVTYTGVGGTTFTGASGGTGTMSTGSPVIPANVVAANPNNDLWNGYGTQITGQSGAAATISSVTSSIAVITGLTGMTAASVGRVLIISNAINGAGGGGNNGVFRIVTFTSATQVSIHNDNAVSSEGNNGSLVWQEMDSAAYVGGQTGSTANITTITTGRIVTVTGLTGMTPLSTNRYLTITGAASANNNGTFKILSYISSTSVTIINFSGVASDANNGSISWKEMDPLLENYLLLQGNAWLCMQGPSTLKIPITTAATGTFLRGENITQATTAAQGEIIGYTFDTVAAAGYLVVMPRVHGNGAGALGWNNSSLITGGTSGATVTPSANPSEFTREFIFYCSQSVNSLNAVNMWMQVVDGYTAGTENASRFSVLQASTGCTAVVPPGGGGTGNTFPVPGTQTVMGNAVTSFTANTWGAFTVNSSIFGYSHFMCADTTYDSNRSADGSFCGAVGITNGISPTTANSNGSYIGCLWTRCEAQEDGDVDPYVFYMPTNDAVYTAASRTLTSNNAFAQHTNTEHFTASSSLIPGGTINWGLQTIRAWKRRGFALGDTFQNCSLFTIGHTDAARSFASQANGSLNQYNDPSSIVTRNNAVLGEPIWVISAQAISSTTIAAGSNGQSLPQATINVASTTGFSNSGTISVVTSGGTQSVTYTGIGGTTFTGCSGGTGTMSTGGAVTSANSKVRKGIMRWARLVNTGTATDLYHSGLYIQLSSSLPAMIVGPWDKRTFPIR